MSEETTQQQTTTSTAPQAATAAQDQIQAPAAAPEQATGQAQAAQDQIQGAPAKPKAQPRLFFNRDSRVEISVNGYHSNDTGELAFVLLADDKDAAAEDRSLDELFTKVNYRFWFTRCPYNRYNRYRTSSMIYNTEDQNNTINELKLRELFLVFHLVDWNLTDAEGKRIELKFDPNKALSEESLNLIYTLPSMLIDLVLSTYEKRMSL